jgi:hypothetical protein
MKCIVHVWLMRSLSTIKKENTMSEHRCGDNKSPISTPEGQDLISYTTNGQFTV